MPANFDGPRDGRPVANLGDAHTQHPGGALQSVVGGGLEVDTGADEGDWSRLLQLVQAERGRDGQRPSPLFRREGPSEKWQILLAREQNGPVDRQALQDVDLEGDGAGDVAGVA